MNIKSLPLFTSELNRKAWAIRRSLASLNHSPLMAISWRECLRRASNAMILAVAKARRDAEDAARLAEIQNSAMAIAHRRAVESDLAAGAGYGYFYARECAA